MKTFKPFKHKGVFDLKDMQEGDHCTHGDLSIYMIPADKVPMDFDKYESVEFGVLAEGEAHAHAHQLFNNVESEKSRPAFELLEGDDNAGIKYDLRKHPDGYMFLKVEGEPMLLKHQTHNPFRIYPGNYDIDFQVEKDHWSQELRRLAD